MFSPSEIVVVFIVLVSCIGILVCVALMIRENNRRLTRLTLAFSKKWENFEAAVALRFGYYNFVKIHKTLRCTPGNGRRSRKEPLDGC